MGCNDDGGMSLGFVEGKFVKRSTADATERNPAAATPLRRLCSVSCGFVLTRRLEPSFRLNWELSRTRCCELVSLVEAGLSSWLRVKLERTAFHHSSIFLPRLKFFLTLSPLRDDESLVLEVALLEDP